MPPRRILDDSSDEEIADTSNRVPSDKQLEKGLRDAVAKIFRTGNLENLTVKRVRLATESALDLEEGFFKGHDEWKSRSERIIKEEAETHQEKSEEQDEITNQPPTPPPTKISVKKSAKQDSKEQKSSTSKKKRRKISSDEDEEVETSPPTKSTHKSPKSISEAKTVQEYGTDDSENEELPQQLADEAVAQKSESEMSVLIDEEPKPKKRQRNVQSAPKSKGRKTKATSKLNADLDPDRAEIRRLQGWLIKCGIRKMWARELAPYETPRAKIKHLKQMLEDAGMKGRYSVEKANQIRDERELQADLEAVKEGASRWGTSGVQDGSDSEEEKPRRRLVKGRQSLAFLSDDGRETD